jgi:hypothetical protein
MQSLAPGKAGATKGAGDAYFLATPRLLGHNAINIRHQGG